jgi:hypothetical protein
MSALGFTAAAVTSALILVGTPGETASNTADAAIIHHTSQALTPPANKILHTVVAGDGFGAQTWQLTSPPYTFLGMKGPLGHEQQEAGVGTTSLSYDVAANTIEEHPGVSRPSFSDPLSAMRQDLQDGQAEVMGSTTTYGIPTYEIRIASNGTLGPDSLIAYVDRRSYRPLLLADPQRNGQVVMLRVLTFEYLPATPANRRLLSLTARHPGARVVTDAGAGAK